jgi:hypothetical protein
MKVPTFSSGKPEDWIVWRRNYMYAVSVNEWDDLRARRQAAGSMEGVAGQTVGDILPERPLNPRFLLMNLLDEFEARFFPVSA